ncbi:MAG: aldehyde ferredoxin oxidoreductase family protein [Halobacteriota archaeon]
MDGFHGNLLAVDLDDRTVETVEIPDRWLRSHLGGRGLGIRLLLDRQPADVDPLGPENTLVFTTGPLTGTGVPGASRVWVGSKSPLTGSLGESFAGGRFGRQLALSGFDGVVIRGTADEPVVLEVTDGDPALRPAADQWGRRVDDCTEDLAPGARSAACIGPAGERQVRIAAIITDDARAAAGRGLAAVMGAKRLKGVVVGGSTPPPIADPDRLHEERTAFMRSLRENDRLMAWGEFGTTTNVEILNERGMLPTKNFADGSFDGAAEIGGAALDGLTVDQHGCVNCPVKCKNTVSTTIDEETVRTGGPEYETIVSFGSLVMNDDLATITEANRRCNAYGLDTIGTGHAIAAAMEATERYEWGDSRAILELIEKIAHREGIGMVLADGPKPTEDALELDGGVAHIKGAPASMHDPRGKKGVGLSAAVSPRGGTHTEGFDDALLERAAVETALPVDTGLAMAETAGKPEAVIVFENAQSFVNSLVFCSHLVTTVGRDRNYRAIVSLVEATTGLDLDVEASLLVGERNFTLGKVFAAREGFTVDHDDLPDRLRQPIQGSPAGTDLPELSFSADELATMRERYYALRGWTDEGIEPGTLERLGLGDLIDDRGAVDRPRPRTARPTDV